MFRFRCAQRCRCCATAPPSPSDEGCRRRRGVLLTSCQPEHHLLHLYQIARVSKCYSTPIGVNTPHSATDPSPAAPPRHRVCALATSHCNIARWPICACLQLEVFLVELLCSLKTCSIARGPSCACLQLVALLAGLFALVCSLSHCSRMQFIDYIVTFIDCSSL